MSTGHVITQLLIVAAMATVAMLLALVADAYEHATDDPPDYPGDGQDPEVTPS